jgi:hypothetical protein
LTVTRGVDGTNPVSHNAGAVFRHGVSARDFDEANAFVNGGGVPNSLIQDKSKIAVGNGSSVVALAAGADGTVLTADSTTASGLAYKAPASGGLSPFLLMGA